LLVTVTVVLAGLLVIITLVSYTARLVVAEPGRHRLFRYSLSTDGQRIYFTNEPATLAIGNYGLWFDQGKEGGGHALIGRVLSISADNAVVEREVLSVTGGRLEDHSRGLWTGHVFGRPSELGIPFKSIELTSAGRTLPCWLFTPAHLADSCNWVVHIHGIRTTRLTTLRNVGVASRAGFVSIVPSFRSDAENVRGYASGSGLGLSEWNDVEKAITYARDHGAKNVILFGLSLGGLIALLLATRSRNSDLVRGLILVGPVTNFPATIRYGAAQLGLPSWVGTVAMIPLKLSPWYRLAGTPAAIDFSSLQLNDSRELLAVPTLVVQSPNDDEVPYSETLRFANSNSTVTLSSSFKAFHTCEWNVDPAKFESTINNWLNDNRLTAKDLNGAAR